MTSEFDDPDNLRAVMGYYGLDPRVRLEAVEEIVLNEDPGEWSLLEFLSMIDEAVSRIPEEFRAKAIVSLEGSYEERSSLIIFYERPETDEEMAARQKEALNYLRRQDYRERAAFEHLKRKFEPS